MTSSQLQLYAIKDCQNFFHLWQSCLESSAELHRGTRESWVSSSGKELCFDLGSITSPLCAFIFSPISLCFDIWQNALELGLSARPYSPGVILLPSAAAVTSWHSANGSSEKPHLPFPGAAGVLISCIHWCASILRCKVLCPHHCYHLQARVPKTEMQWLCGKYTSCPSKRGLSCLGA